MWTGVLKIREQQSSCLVSHAVLLGHLFLLAPSHRRHIFENAGTWKSNSLILFFFFGFSKIIASRSLGCACDSLFSWRLPLKCKTAIKWVWDSSCWCRGLVSWRRSQTQNTSPDGQPIRSSQTVKLLYYTIMQKHENIIHCLVSVLLVYKVVHVHQAEWQWDGSAGEQL